ncbi:hypothetical protein [Rhodoferax sp.]|uniref:hypothetical protein n=1 Tax=Rhodoferax sp. TaxID=50421 RepID=UPI00374CD80C
MFDMNGGIWKIGPVKDEPEVSLEDWSVFEVLLPGNGVRTRHFAGTAYGREGRASSPVASFDAEARKGMTVSGRVYKLIGKRTGLCSDARYVWNNWMRINQAQDVVDVTAEIEALILGGSS